MQSSEIRKDVSLHKQFMQWSLSHVTCDNQYFKTINDQFSIDPTPGPFGKPLAQCFIKECVRFRLFCAEKHLEFCNYQIPLSTYAHSVEISEKYNEAKNYKTWHETSWLPKIFWFWYKKPDLHDFYKLQMQYRYVKNAQRLGIFKNAY